MTVRQVPNLRKVKLLDLAHPCPEAGRQPRTRQPRARLDRWSVLRDLLVDAWANPDHEEDELLGRHLGALSPLEASLVSKMYRNVSRIFPVLDGFELDLEGRSLSYDDPDSGVTASVHLTFSVNHPDGTVEHVRLKTGRSPSTAEEGAVVWSSAEDGESFTDLMAWPGEVEPIVAPSDAEQRLQHLVETSPMLTRTGVRPGRQCVWCDRSALCGAYPAPRVVPSNAPTLNITKTDLVGIQQCHRQVAWRRVHGIPRDDGDDEGPPATSQGRLFHAMVAAAGDGDEAEAAATDYLDGVPPSEVADLRFMWENHRLLLRSEGLAVRSTEFPVGLTLLEGERAETRGATLIGFVDLTARDAQGLPVAVELKTGSAGDGGLESDLYAAGMRRWVGDRGVTIHRHFVRSSPPTCEVVTYSPDEVTEAEVRLRSAVAPVHGWDWDDPLQPEFRVGEWCNGCEFRSTCESYR